MAQYVLEKKSDSTKAVHVYSTANGSYSETFEGGEPIAFASKEDAEKAKLLINGANDPSNHVELKHIEAEPKKAHKEEPKEEPKVQKSKK